MFYAIFAMLLGEVRLYLIWFKVHSSILTTRACFYQISAWGGVAGMGLIRGFLP